MPFSSLGKGIASAPIGALLKSRYLRKTIQVVPHITEEIQKRIKKVAIK